MLTAGVRVKVPDTGTATRLIIKHPEIFRDYEIIKGRSSLFINSYLQLFSIFQFNQIDEQNIRNHNKLLTIVFL